MTLLVKYTLDISEQHRLLNLIQDAIKQGISAKRNRLVALGAALHINCISILEFAMHNLELIQLNEGFIITFSKTKKIYGRLLQYWLRLINYGTLSIQGCNLISEIFDAILAELDKVYAVGD